ncbi:hypothetical protein AB0N81_38460 [Streptomyces sp. NPDC093510]
MTALSAGTAALGAVEAGPALAAEPPCEYDPAIMRTSWEDGRWGG